MSLGSQRKLADILYDEGKRTLNQWKEELLCAHRLLLATSHYTPSHSQQHTDPLSVSERTGGGYYYATRKLNPETLEKKFLMNNRGPWGDDPIAHGVETNTAPSLHDVRCPTIFPERCRSFSSTSGSGRAGNPWASGLQYMEPLRRRSLRRCPIWMPTGRVADYFAYPTGLYSGRDADPGCCHLRSSSTERRAGSVGKTRSSGSNRGGGSVERTVSSPSGP
eukprot:Filipodium_phascolosomae@DN5863_c0_g1_i1.p1